LRRIAAFLLAVAGILVPATDALSQTNSAGEPSIGIRLLEVPINLAHDPRASVYIIDHVAPGTTISRRIGVSNTGSNAVRVQLYSGAAVIRGGAFVAEPAGQNNDLSTWISVTPSVVNVPPDGQTTATATIAVPQGATPGERYGVVWAQPPAGTGSGGVAVVNRVGIRVYLSVGSGPAPPIDFTIDSLTAFRDRADNPFVTALVHNTGGRALDLSGSLTLTNGPGGTRAGPFRAKLGTTLGIGQTEPVTIPVDRRIPLGPWSATVTLTSDQVTRAASATISFPNAPGKSTGPVRATPVRHRGPLFLSVAGIAAAAIAGALVLLWLLWRRRKEDETEGASRRRT
jgi:hypothetical protein